MKRAISVFLSVILVLTLIPALAFGAGTVYFSAGFFSPVPTEMPLFPMEASVSILP